MAPPQLRLTLSGPQINIKLLLLQLLLQLQQVILLLLLTRVLLEHSVPPQQRPLSVAVTFIGYDTRDLSRGATRVTMPDVASILNGPWTSRPPARRQ